MVEIIPAINAETWEEVRDKIRRIEHFTKWIHLDIADGTYTKNTLWHNPLDLVGFETVSKIEVHMMEDHPEDRFQAWILPGVRRIIFQEETVSDFDFLLDELRREGVEAGISVGTDVSWIRLKPYIRKADLLQILAVHPGRAGQEFQGHNYSKIRHLRALCPDCKIEVDGGIKLGVARLVAEAGANILAAASSVFRADNPELAIRVLQNDAEAGEHGASSRRKTQIS